MADFTLQILHASDLEGGVEAIENAPNFAAIVDKLEDEFDNSITLSAGDNYIPGPFFNASGDRSLRSILQEFYQNFFNDPTLTNIREGVGRVDISIMNAIGFDASAIGNHEFDAGSSIFADIIGTDIRGESGGDVRWLGAQFPYLSGNLDFSNDGNLSGLFTNEILINTEFQSNPDDLDEAANAPKIAQATVVEENGEKIGIIGTTTPELAALSSPGDTSVIGSGTNDMEELANLLQPIIDDVIDGDDNIAGNEDDVNKIVLISHLQQISLEEELIPLLKGVDISIAGGSDTILANNNNTLRAGDEAEDSYPIVTTNGDGEPAVIVNTGGEYSYVGRLIVDFDENGVIVAESIQNTLNGPIATTQEQVDAIWGEEEPFAEGTKGEQVQTLTNAVEDVVIAKDGEIFGLTDVFLEGRRSQIRTEETNLGNLTADANLAAAQEIDPTVTVSLKNGGGIRAAIGEIDQEGNLLPPQANPAAGKLEGEISQLDIENTLRFNNSLTLLTLTAEELLEVIEHSVSATEEGETPGQFPQVSGIKFSFDSTDEQNNPIVGDRVESLAIVDENNNIIDIIVENGEIVGNPDREIRVVTLNFLAGGGDGYPFDVLGDNVVETGIGEQEALADYLSDNFSTTPFMEAEVAPELDQRIQNLDFRNDTVLNIDRVFDETISGDSTDNDLAGTQGNDDISAADGNDTVSADLGDDIVNGDNGNDILNGNQDSDIVNGNQGNDTVYGGKDDDTVNGGADNDSVFGDLGDDIVNGDDGNDMVNGNEGDDLVNGGAGDDTVYGGKSDDTVNGGTDNDFVFGNLGDDVVSGNSGNDFVNGNEGDDTVNGGNGDDTLRGGKEDDLLSGGEGDDHLYGDFGDDTLIGGIGSDRFSFRNNPETEETIEEEGTDMINDFNVDEDLIQLVGSLFNSELGSEQFLSESQFIIGSVATDGLQRIIYDQSTGSLFYDADGIGAIAAINFAQLDSGLAFSASNVYIA